MRNADQIQHYLNIQHEIPGWFSPGDMLLFAYLGEIQEECGFVGNLCDVGVYQGKSLSLLCLMKGNEEAVFGIDHFRFGTVENARAILRTACGRDDLATLIVRDVGTCDVQFLRGAIPGPVRFLSLDADHGYEETLRCLANFSQVMDGAGIIAVDDYYDRSFPGVSAATHTFLSQQSTTQLVPFALGPNKIYLCERALAVFYLRRLIAKPPFRSGLRLKNMYNRPVLITFVEQRKDDGRHAVDADEIAAALSGWQTRDIP